MNGFQCYDLPADDGLYEELLASMQLEDAAKGRQGAVLTRVDGSGEAPLVRTTARFRLAPRRFRQVDERLARAIQERASLSMGFNNALFERYTHACTTMGSHSDMALDLADASFIAVFSCYQRPAAERAPRRLIVEAKEPGGGGFEIPLAHMSAVVFSVDVNRRFRHKIVLSAPPRAPENLWLGLTLRTSKTFVRFRGELAHFSDGSPLTLADDEERRELLGLRRRENHEIDFAYPRIGYTLSEGDLLPPEPRSG